MDKFVTRKPRKGDADLHTSSECDFDCAVQPPGKVSTTSSSSTNNKPNYKKNLTYDVSWKKKPSWMNYDSTLKGMVCTVCEVYGKVPVQAKGAWVTRPLNNWAKAITLLANHEKSEQHLAAVERRAFSQSAEKRSDVIADVIIVAFYSFSGAPRAPKARARGAP